MGTRRYSTRGINIHQSYSIDEACFILDVTPQTIRRWINEEELEAMTSRKPYLIHGADLKAHIENQRKKGRGLKPGEFSCFSCRTKALPFGLMADYFVTGSRQRLSALCGKCEHPVSLFVGPAKLASYSEILDVAIGVAV